MNISCSNKFSDKIIIISIVFIILSGSLDKIYSDIVLGLHISLSIISLFFAFSVSMIMFLHGRKVDVKLFTVAMLVLAYFYFEILMSVQIGRAMTYWLLLFLNIFVYLIFSQAVSVSILSKVRIYVYILGCVITALIISKYLHIILFDLDSILMNESLWLTSSGEVYEVLFGRYIAYQGYSGDPNAVGMSVAIILFFGMATNLKKHGLIVHFVNSILILVIMISFSRGAIGSLFVTLFVVGFILGVARYKYYFILLVLCSLILLFGSEYLGELGFEAINPINKFALSMDRRFGEWAMLINEILEGPIIGHGLRYDENLLGKYAENSYLALMLNTGLVGLFLFNLLIGLVYILAMIRSVVSGVVKEVIPWLAFSTYLMLTMMYSSIELKPILWITFMVVSSVAIGGFGMGKRIGMPGRVNDS